MRVVVLGGAGFIGAHLVRALMSEGHDVRVFDKSQAALESANFGPDIECLVGDFSDSGSIASALDSCDVCYHLISTTLPKSSNIDPVFDVESNVVATLGMLRAAVELGVGKVVFLSSGGTVYGNPVSVPISEGHPTEPLCSYGISKLAIEKYLSLYSTLHGLDYTVLRLSNPYGEGQRLGGSQGAVAVFLGRILAEHGVEIWGDGSVVRDYVYIADVAGALLAALRKGSGKVINIGSGYGLSLNQILDSIETVTGRAAKRIYMPSRAFDVPCSILSIDRARAELDWEPKIGFEEGLLRMVDSLRCGRTS